MYAIFETGGAQHRVSEGDTIRVEKLPESAGGSVSFDKVLLVKNGEETLVGSPYLENATVEATVADEGLGDKTLVFKKKRRTKYRRLNGHRQSYSEIQIKKISLG